MPEGHKNDCISHYPMWSALCKKVVVVSSTDDEMVTIAGDETNPDLTKFQPLRPISAFKHYQQFDYNRSKWGLDKNTECLILCSCWASRSLLKLVTF
jgi:hypothetical protein